MPRHLFVQIVTFACRRSGLAMVGILLVVFATSTRRASAAGTPDPSAAFFARTNAARFEIQLSDSALARLQRSPRTYARGTVRVDGRVIEDVGVRLKGFSTFRPIHGQPNFALKFNQFTPGQEFEGLTKLMLNNSIHDPSRLCEYLASSVFADAGVPIARVTQAAVTLNGRELGCYVVTEAVNERFLKRHFTNPHGNLYEGAFDDITARLDQDGGETTDHTDLQALAGAASMRDPEQRREALGRVLNVEAFLRFLAVEMIVANWDGFALHQNNYRIYHDPGSDRMYFLPHGLDNALFEPRFPLMPPRSSRLTKALLATPPDRADFSRRVAALAMQLFDVPRLTNRIQTALGRLRGAARTEKEARHFEQCAADVGARLAERSRWLADVIADVKPPTVNFDASGQARLTNWVAQTDWNRAPVEARGGGPGRKLCIQARGGFCTASWRQSVWLAPGRYRISGVVTTRDVDGFGSRTGGGAGVRVLGAQRGGGVDGTATNVPVEHAFSVQSGCERVELIVELRAFAGEACFEADSLRLTRE